MENQDASAAVARLKEARDKLRAEGGQGGRGPRKVLDALLVGLRCRGHVLMLACRDWQNAHGADHRPNA